MSDNDPGEATRLLKRVSAGDARALELLMALIYGELRRIAKRQLRNNEGHTLQPTAVVNEAWLRLVQADSNDFTNKLHFLGVAARAMRSVVVDHLRGKTTQKRDGRAAESETAIDGVVEYLEGGECDLLDLNEALAELERDDADLARLVELRFFGGLSHERIAEVLDCSLSTVERRWRLARARLHKRLDGRMPS